jgi:hypothetical protein
MALITPSLDSRRLRLLFGWKFWMDLVLMPSLDRKRPRLLYASNF